MGGGLVNNRFYLAQYESESLTHQILTNFFLTKNIRRKEGIQIQVLFCFSLNILANN